MNTEIEAIKRHLDALTAQLAAQQIALKFLARDLTGEQLHDLAGFAAWEYGQLRHTSLTDHQFGLVPSELQRLFESFQVETPKTHQESGVLDTKGLRFPW